MQVCSWLQGAPVSVGKGGQGKEERGQEKDRQGQELGAAVPEAEHALNEVHSWTHDSHSYKVLADYHNPSVVV